MVLAFLMILTARTGMNDTFWCLGHHLFWSPNLSVPLHPSRWGRRVTRAVEIRCSEVTGGGSGRGRG